MPIHGGRFLNSVAPDSSSFVVLCFHVLHKFGVCFLLYFSNGLSVFLLFPQSWNYNSDN